jgi:hypothetical protein
LNPSAQASELLHAIQKNLYSSFNRRQDRLKKYFFIRFCDLGKRLKKIYYAILHVTVFITFLITGSASAADLVVWLVPLVRDCSPHHIPSEHDLKAFNSKYGIGKPVRVLNTTIPALRDQLLIRNPESPEPNLSTIISQQHTLTALQRFATNNDITLDVRFIKWGRMFSEINETLLKKLSGNHIKPPDVVQIGSTWKSYLKKHMPIIQDDHVISSQPYTYDLRLLFYWRRLPVKDHYTPISIRGKSWDQLLDEFYKYQSKYPGNTQAFLAMPIGLTLNILHDYAPLVWAGNSDFIIGNSKVDLTSNLALKTPLLIANKSVQTSPHNPQHVRVISFPETGHVEAIDYFLSGKYRAIIEPLGFLKHWQKIFHQRYREIDEAQHKSLDEFSDYMGIAPLPVTYQGGSELMITTVTKASEIAQKFVNFLIEDKAHLADLAKNGYLPANLPYLGIDIMLKSLEIPDHQHHELMLILNQAWLTRRSYPAMADWPTKVETIENFEALQKVWRRIAQGNEDKMALSRITEAAKEAEYTFNKRINSMVKFWDASLRVWPILALFPVFILFVIVWFMYSIQKRQHKQILALLLFRAKFHSIFHAYGAAVIDFCELPPVKLPKILEQYGTHIAGAYNHHMANMAREVSLDLSGKPKSNNLFVIINKAINGACKEYYAAYAKQAPASQIYVDDTLKSFNITSFGNILIVLLQEWIFNTYKSRNTNTETMLEISVTYYKNRKQLSIISNVPITVKHSSLLMDKPSSIKDIENWAKSEKIGGQGLSLIRDLLWYSYKSKIQVKSVGVTTELLMPVPAKYRGTE